MARPRIKINQRTQERIRQEIKAGKLIKFLQEHALDGSELTSEITKAIEDFKDAPEKLWAALSKYETSRIDAAKFLLSRVVSPPVPKDDDGKTPSGPVIIAWQ